jgi:IS5 family transposase
MTFGTVPYLPPTDLPTQWQMEIEDAATYRPDILWFMGSDARVDSPVCSPLKLPQWGFHDGRTARLHLLRLVREAGLVEIP